MKKVVVFSMCFALLFAVAFAHDGTHDGDNHSGGDDSGSSGKGSNNKGDGYKDFVSGKTLATFSVTAGTSQSFHFEEGARTLTVNALLSGSGTFNLTVKAVTSLGTLNLGDRFKSLPGGLFSLAYAFTFDGTPNVTSLTLQLDTSGVSGELAQLLKQYAAQSNFGLFFISAVDRFLGKVEVEVSQNPTNNATLLEFQLLPTSNAVYFFSTFNGTDLPVLFDTKQKHGGKERVKLAFDKGLLLDFVNGKNCTSSVSFKDSDKHSSPKNHTALGKFFEVEVTDQDALDATLVFKFNATELAAKGFKPKQLRWALLAENGTWIIQVKSSVDEVKFELKFKTSHFSTWGVFAASDETNTPLGSDTRVASSSVVSAAPVAVFAVVVALIALVL